MSKRLAQLVVFACLVGPLVQLSCGSSEERKFASGTGGGGTGGSVGGSAGSSVGGTGATTTGGSGGAADGGKACAADPECDDGNVCNGKETCTNSLCQPGSNLSDGTSCTPNFGDAGPPDGGTGEYLCASGQCLVKCVADADCEDNDTCTGKEICNPTTNTCLSGTPPTCEDNDACTDNLCDITTGCIYPLKDADADSHAPTSLGSCGDDCDDNDPAIYAGAAELCDNKDNNCNGAKDELSPIWYVDCDMDTFAEVNAPSVQQCDAPTAAHPSCNGNVGWTSQAPGVGTADCWDKDGKAHPYTAANNYYAFQTTAMTGGAPLTIDFDYNCDGPEEKEFTTVNIATNAACTTGGLGGFGNFSGILIEPSAAGGVGNLGGIGGIGGIGTICSGKSGWSASTSPVCGSSATWSNCGGSPCARTYYSKTQRCR